MTRWAIELDDTNEDYLDLSLSRDGVLVEKTHDTPLKVWRQALYWLWTLMGVPDVSP